MKIKTILVIITSLLISWLLPAFVHKITDKPSENIFAYYSSVEKSFCVIEFDKARKTQNRINLSTGKKYTRNEFDSILPLFYYRQLLSEGKMPDSIQDKPIKVSDLNTKIFFFRYFPKEKNSPKIPLYILFESKSGRINLESPTDMFRIGKRIEFINPETNAIDNKKSELFNAKLTEQEFKFSPQMVACNPSARKPYEEGCFILDKDNQLFHLKMQRGKPYVKHINMPDSIKLRHISTVEPKDRSFYAFLFDNRGFVYKLTTNNYKIERLPIEPIDIDKQILQIMGNPLYWNVSVSDRDERTIYAISNETKALVDKHTFKKQRVDSKWLSYIFPYELTLMNSNTLYIKPSIKIHFKQAIILNIVLVVLFILIFPKKKYQYSIFTPIWILVTGIFGILAELPFIKN